MRLPAKFDLVTTASVLEEIDEPRAFCADKGHYCRETACWRSKRFYAPLVLTRTAADAMAGGVSAV
ncbi:MAG: hypothetical protein R3C40_07710 [Parvularculaceae bacterium]